MRSMACVDIFRVNDDGKIIEHWDVPSRRDDRLRERHVLPTHLVQGLLSPW